MTGASGKPDRAVVNGAASVSALRASVPSANGPALWDELLALMPSGSVIAGGAVRDYLLGFEPKDIDIFMGVYAGTCEPAAEATGLVEFEPLLTIGADPRHGLFRIDNEHERFAEYQAVSNIVMVSSGTLLGVKVDAILIEDFEGGERLIDGFDFAITRCWYDGEIHDTAEARRDREAQTITLLSDEREARSVARFERLKERWGGGWQLVRDAQAIEARQGGNGEAGAVHESAVAESDAP